MGSANSNAEALEKRRIEREMRLGLYAGPTAGLNPSQMGMRPVNPYQHLGWPAQEWLCGPGAAPPHSVPPQDRAQLHPQFHQPAVAESRPQQTRISPTHQHAPQAMTPRRSSVVLPKRVSPSTRQESPSPTRLRWVGTPPRRKSSSPRTMDLLSTPARRTSRYMQDTEKGGTRSDSSQKRRAASGRNSVPPPPSRAERQHNSSTLKPSMKQALYLLAVEEIEERTTLLSEEADAFDGILALFSYAVEMELIRVAAFEIFGLERKTRKAIRLQEKRERHILAYWAAENHEDAKLCEGIRTVQSRPSPQRTPSRSPWRFPLRFSEDRHPQPSERAIDEKSSFMANPYTSPSPIPPEHHHHRQHVPGPDSRFGVPSRFFQDVDEDEHNGAKERVARFAPMTMQATPSTRQTKPGIQGQQADEKKRLPVLKLELHCPEEPTSAQPPSLRVASSRKGAIATSAMADSKSEPTGVTTRAAAPGNSGAGSCYEEQADTTAVANAPGESQAKPQDTACQRDKQNAGPQEGAATPPTASHHGVPNPSKARVDVQQPRTAAERTTPPKMRLRTPPEPIYPDRERERRESPERAGEGETDTHALGSGERGSPKRDGGISRRARGHQGVDARPTPVPPNQYHKVSDHQLPSRSLDGLSPIEADAHEESPSSSSSVYLDPFAVTTPKKRRQPSAQVLAWTPELGRRQEELDQKILMQRGSMSVGSPLPFRAAPLPPASPSESEPSAGNGMAYENARLASTTAVNDRFAALLKASL